MAPLRWPARRSSCDSTGQRRRDDPQLERIAEYVDSSVLRTPRRGSLAPVPGRRGLSQRLYARLGNAGNGILTGAGAATVIGLSGLWAWLVDEPLVFPSLGATAFLCFETPLAEVASPRNTLIGHAVGVGAGYLGLVAFGLTDDPSVLVEGVAGARIGAVALALGVTGLVLRLLRAAHPPAGATTIIVSAGLLQTGHELLAIGAGVVLLCVAAYAVNRALGVPAPRWRA